MYEENSKHSLIYGLTNKMVSCSAMQVFVTKHCQELKKIVDTIMVINP